MREMQDENLPQVRVERSETTEPLAATARRASEASHPARPTNVERRPKGAFLLCVFCRVALRLPGLQDPTAPMPGKPALPGMSYA